MFAPAIYITHKTLRQIVDIELANEQYKNEHKHLKPKYDTTYLTKAIHKFQKEFCQTIHSESVIEEFVRGRKEIKELRPVRNALQATTSHKTSLRAEDDWNLLSRTNHLICDWSNALPTPQLRTEKKFKGKVILQPHEFENSAQLKHFVLELFRWYRTSDKDINRILRTLVVLFHLIKSFPFSERNLETIIIVYSFILRENKLDIFYTIDLYEKINKIDKEIELNEFLNLILEQVMSEKNKLFFKLEKQSLEKSAPKKILNLNKRQIELLKVMQARDKITRRETADLFEVSFMTAYRDIKGLLKKKLLVERGVGRGTYYVLASK